MMIIVIFTILVLILVFLGSANSKKATLLRLQRQEIDLIDLWKNITLKSKKKITLTNFQDIAYYANIYIGTPPQILSVKFDTGSTDFWVLSSEICSANKTYCKPRKTYDHTKSSTYVEVGRNFDIFYLVGEVKGVVSQDTVGIGGIIVKEQIFGEGVDITASFQARDVLFNGICGFAFKELSLIGSDPLFISMINQSLVDKPVFAFYLNSKDEPLMPGEIVLGGIDERHYSGSLTYTPVQKDMMEPGYWTIKLDLVSVGSKEITSEIAAIPDSGSSVIAGPYLYIRKFNVEIGALDPYCGDGRWCYVDCKSVEKLPNLTFTIENIPFVLNPKDYITKDDDGCRSVIAGFSGLFFFILGLPFMKKYYTIFDMGESRVAFALATNYTSDLAIGDGTKISDSFNLLYIVVFQVILILISPNINYQF